MKNTIKSYSWSVSGLFSLKFTAIRCTAKHFVNVQNSYYTVTIMHFISDSKKFSNLEKLGNEIVKDVEAVEEKARVSKSLPLIL